MRHKHGKIAEGRKHLDAAVKWIDTPEKDNAQPWDVRLRLRMLRDEAKGRYDGPAPKKETENGKKSGYNAGMNQIDAIFQNGVFKPLGPVELKENEHVRLSVEPVARPDLLAWLERVRKHQQEFIAKHGYLPDSTPDIAEDRLRDI